MLFLIFLLSCAFTELKVKWKMEDEDSSRVVRSTNSRVSVLVLGEADCEESLQESNSDLLPIEKAIEARDVKMVRILMGEYPFRVYEKIVDTKSLEMFREIPKKYLDYRLLTKIKDKDDKELEEEFLIKIGATELEKLIVRGQFSTVKDKNRDWIIENYKSEKGSVLERAINTTDILCIYGKEDLAEEILDKLRKKEMWQQVFASAAEVGNKKIIGYLLGMGIYINMELDAYGNNALMLAAQNGYVELCEFLLANEASADIKNFEGNTALMLAIKSRQRKVCELLLSRMFFPNKTSEDEVKLLFLAVKSGERDICELLLEKGIEVNLADENGTRALMQAVKAGKRDICELLLDNGAEVNATRVDGVGALMLAAKNGERSICELLLDRGADINSVRIDGVGAISLAAKNGERSICKLLIERGAKIDSENEKGVRALMYAANKGHKEVCELLLEKGAKLSVADNGGNQALSYAAENGHGEVCGMLLDRGAKVNASGKNGIRALMYAAGNGHRHTCEILINRGAKIDAVDEDGSQALMTAAEDGYEDVCQLLIDRGAEVNAKNNEGWGALTYAAENGYERICKLLIKKGAELNSRDNGGSTALMVASQNGHEDICRLLLDQGADVSIEDDDGWRALIYAAGNGHKKICELLLERGADANAVSNIGYGALMYAAQGGYKEIFKLLLERGDTGSTNGGEAFMYAVKNGHKEVCELLLERDETGKLNRYFWRALMLAVGNGHREVCKLLLAKKVSINDVKEGGWTLLTLAAWKGYSDVCELLLNRGAEVDLERADGRRALILAAQNGHENVCKLLLSRRANVDAPSKYYWTALMIAAQSGHENICKLLLDNGARANAVTRGRRTALMLASAKGYRGVCEMLIDAGALVDAVREDGSTSLIIAASGGHERVCELLLDRGAEVNITREDQSTALMLAAQNGHKGVCELLIDRKARLDASKANGDQALMLAAQRGNSLVCELLVNRGADINAERKDGNRALILAAQSGRQDVCELLLNRGARADVTKEDGDRLFVLSAQNGHKGVCKLLLEKGANVDARRSDGTRALTAAAQNGHKDVCKLLLNMGAKVEASECILAVDNYHEGICELLLTKLNNIDAKNKNGDTVLIVAAVKGRTKLCRFLVELGANVNARNKKGISPLIAAAHNQHLATFTTLLDNGASFNKKTKKIIESSSDFYSPDVVSCLLSSGNFDKASMDYLEASNFLSLDFLTSKFLEIKDMNRRGYISLHFAAMKKEPEILKYLTENDNFQSFIDESSNREKISPLRLAIKHGFMDNAKMLLSKGASPFYSTFFGIKNVLNENEDLMNYLSKKMIFDLLIDKDLENAQKRLYGPNGFENTESYKDIIDLSSLDESGRNVFHYLAECLDDICTSEFLNRAVELKSFNKQLLIQEDIDGVRPIHVAILCSNPYFIQHVTLLGLLTAEELVLGCNSQGIFDIVGDNGVSKETIDAMIKYLCKHENNGGDICSILFSDEKSEGQKKISLISYLNSGNNIYEEFKRGSKLMETIVGNDFLSGLELVIPSIMHDYNVLHQLFFYGLDFSSIKCLNYLKSRINKEDIRRHVNLNDLCVEGKIESLKLVLEFMSDQLVQKDVDGKIPLQAAAESKREDKDDVVDFLLGYDPKKDRIDNSYFEEEEMKFIRKHRDDSGHSMMHSAALALSPHMVNLFYRLGFEMELRDKNDERAIDYIIRLKPTNSTERGKRLGTIYALLCGMSGSEYDIDYIDESVHMAIKMGEDELVEELMNEGLVNARDRDENTPLHIIVGRDNTELLNRIIGISVSYIARNKDGDTALHMAKSVEAMEIIFENAINKGISSKLLLEMPNNKGESVLHKFVIRSQEESMERLIEYALDNRADKNKIVKDGKNRGKNALDIARSIKSRTAVEGARNTGSINSNSVGGMLVKIERDLTRDLSKLNVDKKGRERLGSKGDASRSSLIEMNLDKFKSPSKPIDRRANKIFSLLKSYKPDFHDMSVREERRNRARAKREEDEKDEKDLELVLLQQKDVNSELSGSRRYAVHLAVERNDIELIYEIKRLGADLTLEDRYGINGYKLAIQEGNKESLEQLLKLGDVLDVDSKGESVLEIAVKKGGKYSDIAMQFLGNSDYKEERAFTLVSAFKIVISRAHIDSKVVNKIEKLLHCLGNKKLNLKKGKTLLLEVIEYDNLSLGILRAVLRNRGVEEAFVKDNRGVSASGKILSMRDSDYLLEVMKEVDKSENKVENDLRLLNQIEERLEELVDRNRVDHLGIILDRYEGSFASKIGKDEQFGKLIYMAARKRKRDVVEALLRNFVIFTTKKDIAIEKCRERLSKLIRIAGNSLGLPGADVVAGVVGALVKPKGKEAGLREIFYIDEIYRDGRWAMKLEIIPKKSLLKYYEETARSFREMATSKLKRLMESGWQRRKEGAKSFVKNELGKISDSYLSKTLLEIEKEREEMFSGEEFGLGIGPNLEAIFEELERYNVIYSVYKELIETKIKRIIRNKGRGWNKEIKRELEVRYREIVEARELLKIEIEKYRKEGEFGFFFTSTAA